MTVGELLERIGSAELTEWRAFSELEPFGTQVDDLRAGLGPAMTANVNRGEDSKIVGPLDFFPWHNPPPPAEPEPSTPEELAAAIKSRIFGVKPE